MKIVLMTESFPKLSEMDLVNKFLELHANGHLAYILTNHFDEDAWKYFSVLRKNKKLRSYVYRVSSQWRWHEQISRLFLTLVKPDIVHIEHSSLAVARQELIEWLDCPIVISLRSSEIYLQDSKLPHYKKALEKASQIACWTAEEWQVVQGIADFPDKPCMIIPPKIASLVSPIDSKIIPEEIGTESRPLRLLSIGNLHWEEGFEFALQAVRRVVDAGIKLDYHIVGTGEYLEGLSFCRHQLNLDECVSILKPTSQEAMDRELLWADIYLSSGLLGTGIPFILYAQAMGLPVVATEVYGIGNIVQNGFNGYLSPRRDFVAMSEKLLNLAVDSQKRQGFAENSRQSYLSRLEETSTSFESEYGMLLKNRRP